MADNWQDPVTVDPNDAATSTWANQRRDNETALKLAVEGDASGTVTHKHASGLLANRPSAGEAGRVYVATDEDRAFMDNGTDWLEIGVFGDGAGSPLILPPHPASSDVGPTGLVADLTPAAVVPDRVYAAPIVVPTPTTFQKIIVRPTTSTGNVRLGLYADDGAGLPGALIVDSGSLTVVNPTTDDDISELIPAGVVWVASFWSSNPTAYLTGVTSPSLLLPNSLAPATHWYRSLSFGALPDPFGTPTSVATTGNLGPHAYLRTAA